MRCLLVVLVVAACSHAAPPAGPSPTHVAARWRGPEILASVPADTPYLFGVIEPAPAPLRDRLFTQTGAQVQAYLKKAASSEGKSAVLAAALYQEIEGVDPAHVIDALGGARDGRFVVYGLSIWPVMRLEIKDDVRVRQLIGRLIQAAGSELQPRSVGRAMLYTLAAGKMTIVFGVVGHQLVGAFVPTDSLDRTLPAIIGTDLPAHSLRDAPLVPELLARHRFVPQLLAYADTRRVVDILSGHGKGTNDALASSFANLIPQACQDDAARMTAALPRIALGYRRLDEHGFDMALALEVPSAVGKDLAKLRATMPALPAAPPALFAIGAAADVDATIGWLRGVAHQLQSHPFQCPALGELNHAVDTVTGKIDQSMPPMLQGLRGFEIVVDDFTILPPSGSGELLVEGTHVADTVQQLVAKQPQIAFAVTPDGHPIPLPLAKMGVPPTISSAHFALRPTRAAIAVGDRSADRASALVSAPGVRAPFLTVAYDLPKLRERFPQYFKTNDFSQLSVVNSTTLSVDVGDDGITLEMVGTWAPAPASIGR